MRTMRAKINPGYYVIKKAVAISHTHVVCIHPSSLRNMVIIAIAESRLVHWSWTVAPLVTAQHGHHCDS